MTLSEIVSKRSRVLLGTFVKFAFYGVDESVATQAFEEIQRLELIFNFHDENSVLSEFNRTRKKPSEPEFNELFDLSETLRTISKNAFSPIKNGAFDFSGIAKGFIVDAALRQIAAKCPRASGSIDAGGDIGFLSPPSDPVHLRLGVPGKDVLRPLQLVRKGVATSTFFEDAHEKFGKTRYTMKPARQLKNGVTVVVQADSVAVADALTKVGLFADEATVKNCCQFFNALLLTFDIEGNVIETFGDL